MLTFMDYLLEHSRTEESDESDESDMHVATAQDVLHYGRQTRNSYLLAPGDIFYTKKGELDVLHRENGPAVISPGNYALYYTDGKPNKQGASAIYSEGNGEFNDNGVRRYVKLSDNDIWKALEEDVRCAMVIKTLTPKMQEFVVHEDPSLIEYIQDPSAEVQEYVCQHRPDLVGKIKNLDPGLKAKYQHEEELGRTDL